MNEINFTLEKSNYAHIEYTKNKWKRTYFEYLPLLKYSVGYYLKIYSIYIY